MIGTFLVAIVVSDARIESPSLGGSNKHGRAEIVVVDIIIVNSIKITSGLTIMATPFVVDIVDAMRGRQRGRTCDRAGGMATGATDVGATAASMRKMRRMHRGAVRACTGCTRNTCV